MKITKQHISTWLQNNRWAFTVGLIVLCLSYLILESVYILHLPLIVDEYGGFAQVEKLRSELPYRDHRPYKTVLGYYVQLLPTLFVQPMWSKLLSIKFFTAGLVSLLFLVTGQLLRKIYSSGALLLAMALLFSMSTFLERSAELRVDMLTSLCGLLSLVFLLRGQSQWSGLLAGLSFLVSQKGVYFIFAGGLALSSLVLLSHPRRNALKQLLGYALLLCGTIATYFLFWTIVASFDAVTNTVFGSGVKKIATQVLYNLDDLRMYWFQSLLRNPLFYLLALFSLGHLFWERNNESHVHKNLKLVIYGSTMLAFCLWHRQPWPYFIVILLPTFFVLIVDLFDAEIKRAKHTSYLGLAILLCFGIIFPLQRSKAVLAQDSGYQKQNIELATAILRPEDSYMALAPLFPHHQHRPRSLRWMDYPRSVQTANLPPEEKKELVRELKNDPPKLLVQNYRFRGLPPGIRRYVQKHYVHLHASVFVFQLSIPKQTSNFELPFDGRYTILGSPGAIELDGKVQHGKSTLFLKKGVHSLTPLKRSIHLRFTPQGIDPLINPRYKDNIEFFPDLYRY
ncbi:MAG: hypothetical protein IPJ88_08100 [Myxococcales bacterium]|nr:MAG: hypothetical protein IPJ88_08100 [Myxococcales bacterium]